MTQPLPHVIIISLKQHEERRERLIQALKDYGFSTIYPMNAMDGSTLGPEPPWTEDTVTISPWTNWVDPYARRAMTPRRGRLYHIACSCLAKSC